MNKGFYRIITSLLILLFTIPAMAQEGGATGAYSPYTIYGVGDLSTGGTSHNRSMGGVGVALRNRRFINTMNPAAVTARDTLAFMADFGLSQKNVVFRQNIDGSPIKSAHNTFNIYDFVMSFPIWRSSAFMVGITPFSDLGYSYVSTVTDPEIIGHTNKITYNSYGEGGMYQVFLAAGATFWKRLSIGAELDYYFGTLDKVSNQTYADASIRSVNSGNNLNLKGIGGKFGLQYEQRLNDNLVLGVGLTYRLKTNLKGFAKTYRYATASSVTDTLKFQTDTLGRKHGKPVSLGDEIGVGISLKGNENWNVEFDYTRSGWGNSNFDVTSGLGVIAENSTFKSTATNAYRLGFEITPNRNDVRYYFRRCTYRVGAYHENMYYKLDGNLISASGITLGITLPVYRWYNGITIGIDFGKKGNLRATADPTRSMIRETYCTFNIGFNLHDIWFRKQQYE